MMRTTLLDKILAESNNGEYLPLDSRWAGPDAESLPEAIERESVGAISATDYVKWVQRSLNRLYGINIPTNGRISGTYRKAVRRFSHDYLGRDYGDVDERAQNRLILAKYLADKHPVLARRNADNYAYYAIEHCITVGP